MTKVVYYLSLNNQNPVKDFIDSLSIRQKAKIFQIFNLFEAYGLSAMIPHTKKIASTPLWEIRILGSDNIRIFYVAVKNNRVLVLHGFIKKKQKTPPKEISTALKRYYTWLDK